MWERIDGTVRFGLVLGITYLLGALALLTVLLTADLGPDAFPGLLFLFVMLGFFGPFLLWLVRKETFMKIGIVERITGRRRIAAAGLAQCHQGMDLMSSPEAEASGERFDEPFPGDEGAEEHTEEAGDRKTRAESTQQPTPKVWRHSVGQAEFILQHMSDSLVRVTHRDQVGYIGINQNWDVGEPYSWTFMEGGTGPGGEGIEMTAKPDGIHGSPFGEPTPEQALSLLCDVLLNMQRKEDSQRVNPEERKQAARKVLREFLDELPDWANG